MPTCVPTLLIVNMAGTESWINGIIYRMSDLRLTNLMLLLMQ